MMVHTLYDLGANNAGIGRTKRLQMVSAIVEDVGDDLPGPAAADLRGQAARGRADAVRLQHPEGVDAAPGASLIRTRGRCEFIVVFQFVWSCRGHVLFVLAAKVLC